jgi:hypothetical protein
MVRVVTKDGWGATDRDPENEGKVTAAMDEGGERRRTDVGSGNENGT